jgi:hypothetical protein
MRLKSEKVSETLKNLSSLWHSRNRHKGCSGTTSQPLY